ncbi:MAG: beta-lactamase family protein, partial [Sphingomonadales bacterium]|nr:beta-lactamase family protein [Sphingomonadales bacterium]
MRKQAWPALIALPLIAAAVAPLAIEEVPVEDAETAAPAVVRADLESAIDALFEDEGIGETRALIVLQDGEIVAERYAPGFTADMRYVSWSMAKSVTAVLVGFLVADGRLDLDAPAPIPEWHGEGDPRRAITLRHLLHMSSGLDHVEVNDPVWDSRTNEMLFTSGSDDMAAFAVDRELEAEPGTHYEYSSVTSVILSRIIADALTDSTDPGERAAAFRRFAETRLIGRGEVPSLYFEFDAQGTQI